MIVVHIQNNRELSLIDDSVESQKPTLRRAFLRVDSHPLFLTQWTNISRNLRTYIGWAGFLPRYTIPVHSTSPSPEIRTCRVLFQNRTKRGIRFTVDFTVLYPMPRPL
ncbi:hypothetical protein AG1IA_00736 [Rhizoctonia solani AG-1 IA]|uniref:Uncharacterized protein n=1 Tax=Thanatephorus cucumeris (strain AG1-IA) TaxID=983506 RepID=L8X820_THACA|nr:hypothetical protein AG1IA_00736 [Rhizoctonia solani AG-1 IA]